MKHLLNNLSEEEKQSILEQHNGGMKVFSENFKRLVGHKSGSILNEQPSKHVQGVSEIDDSEWSYITNLEDFVNFKLLDSGWRRIPPYDGDHHIYQLGYMKGDEEEKMWGQVKDLKLSILSPFKKPKQMILSGFEPIGKPPIVFDLTKAWKDKKDFTDFINKLLVNVDLSSTDGGKTYHPENDLNKIYQDAQSFL